MRIESLRHQILARVEKLESEDCQGQTGWVSSIPKYQVARMLAEIERQIGEIAEDGDGSMRNGDPSKYHGPEIQHTVSSDGGQKSWEVRDAESLFPERYR